LSAFLAFGRNPSPMGLEDGLQLFWSYLP
jgi:hypothetical protein